MIKVELRVVQDALIGFFGRERPDGSVDGGIGNEKLGAKAAYRVGRLVSKLQAEMREFREARKKKMLELGGELEGNIIAMRPPVKKEDEADEDFEKRRDEWKGNMKKFDDEIDELLSEQVEIDYDPIPLSLFAPDGKAESVLRPNDVALAIDFLKE